MVRDILPIVKDANDNLLILGKAGVGKSTLIKVVKRYFGKKCIILCPTGIAAQNVKGVTIHSYFSLPLVNNYSQRDINNCVSHLRAPENYRRLQEIETMIIDEISMVNSMVFDTMDRILRVVLNSNQSFGGKRLILIGDIFQLPPIDRDHEQLDDIFFWKSNAYLRGRFTRLELRKVYRLNVSEENRTFERVLENLRLYQTTHSDLAFLNRHYSPNQNLSNTTVLCTRNLEVKRYNDQGIDGLNSRLYRFDAEISPNFPTREKPVPEELKIAVGAPVIFIRNDSNGYYKNGTRGKVLSIDYPNKKIRVLTENEEEVLVGYVEWVPSKNNDSNTKSSAYFRHFPLLLGWALTIHRCQGLTMSKVHLDLGSGAFAPGQLYVALSRLRDISGLSLAKLLRNRDLIESEETLRFYREAIIEEVNLNLSGAELSAVDTQNEVLRTVQGTQLNTKALSIQLFNQGLDIEEILEERSRLGYREILPQTVLGHLVDGFEEVDIDELKDLLCISEELEEDISEELNDIENIEELSWTEIRNALSYHELDWNKLKLIAYLNGFRSPIIRSPKTPIVQVEEVVGEIDNDLFELLRTHRWKIANAHGIEPFQVFHNRTLEEMATTKPTTTFDFLNISGVGPVKLEQYGDSFLKVIRDYLGVKSTAVDESSAYDHALFEKLRSLRNTIANERSLPAFCIFNNDSLKHMATSKPKTSTEFLRIPGVGPARLEEYGTVFLICIINHCK
ncbi:MAG: hypothetical protein FJX80_02350 [Bacteroidetes bacterium]|nr:hypothetical protein [Bacteroidota bacterium]